MSPETQEERESLAALIQTQAQAVEFGRSWSRHGARTPTRQIDALSARVLELEYTLIPHGLHIVGEPASRAERIEMLRRWPKPHGLRLGRAAIEALVDLQPAARAALASSPTPTSSSGSPCRSWPGPRRCWPRTTNCPR